MTTSENQPPQTNNGNGEVPTSEEIWAILRETAEQQRINQEAIAALLEKDTQQDQRIAEYESRAAEHERRVVEHDRQMAEINQTLARIALVVDRLAPQVVANEERISELESQSDQNQGE